MKKIKRILVANRGEIALRIIRSIREMGLESVAVYSDADALSRHRSEADFSYALSGLTSDETYLSIPKLLDAIKHSQADAVHPGYGFLSENAEFAAAVTAMGVKFIGPSAQTITQLGDKVEAKKLMQSVNVPVVPGSDGPLGSWQEMREVVDRIGFPLIIKAAAGGGGRGMRIVRHDDELQDAYEACSREAQMYFGNPAVFCERYIQNPRHIEIQVLFDAHGHGVHLFERDCSIQRRHQKLIEEAPSPFLSEEQRQKLGAIAIKAGEASKYEGVGTVEFICESPEKTYFMEMNTRIQVEHPVTEMVTGIDLIAEQIRVAMGEPLSFTQKDLKLSGWSFEARINAEDFRTDFSPSIGKISGLQLPDGPFVRTDTHIYDGYEIPPYYDSMIAKLIVWGKDRDAALKRLGRALSELRVGGIKTTAGFHEALIQHPIFKSGEFSTTFLDHHMADLLKQPQLPEEGGEESIFAPLLVETSHKHSPEMLTQDQRTKWSEIARHEMQRNGR